MNKKLSLGLRIVLGLIFFVFGLNGFLNFIPQPPMPEKPLKFVMALVESGYLLTLVKGVEVFVGAMLLSGLFVPLALTILAPITINIVLFHTFLAPENGGFVMPIIILIMHLALAYQYKAAYKDILKMK